MCYVSCLDEHWVEVHYKAQGEYEDLNVNTNTFVAAFTTCWARLHLYEALKRLGKRVLYFDTDSVLYVSRPGEPEERRQLILVSSRTNSMMVLRITGICAMMTRPNAKSKDIRLMSRVKPNSITKCCDKTRSTNCVVLWTHLEKPSSIKPGKSYDAPKNVLFTLNRRKRTIS